MRYAIVYEWRMNSILTYMNNYDILLIVKCMENVHRINFAQKIRGTMAHGSFIIIINYHI